MKERVCFFSIDDLSVGYNLELAEKVIAKYETVTPSDINDIIELFHIKKLLDKNCRLTRWTEDEFIQLKKKVEGYNSIIVKFFYSLPSSQLEDNYEILEWDYRQTFWDIIDQFKLFNLVSDDVLKRIIQKDINELRAILHCKFIVDKYKVVIKEILLQNEYSAQFIIEKYISRHDGSSDRVLYLPQNLSMEDKEVIINNYLDCDNPNLNYVRLICQNKDDSNSLVLSPIIKVKANKLAEKLNDELLKDDKSVIVKKSIEIEFSNLEGLPHFCYKKENGHPKHVYSVRFIEQCNNIQLIANCCYLFGWMNKHFLLELIHKNNEADTLETISMDYSKHAYPAYSHFRWKNILSCYQLNGYNNVLSRNKTSFEQELKMFYEIFLKKEYDYPSLSLNIPSMNDSWLNKCRVLFPELDSVVKQYSTYVEYDRIDFDIIKYSGQLKVTEGKSLLINKYYEINTENKEIEHILYNVFNTGSMLHYINHNDKRFRSLYDILINKAVSYEDYKDRQKQRIDFLINHGILKKEDNGILLFVNKEQIAALKSLWEYHSCAYWHYNDDGRKAIDEMFAKGWLIKSDYLLTSEERKYFSYYLDNSKYTNGPAYRNNYAHGSTPPVDDENVHQVAYITILRLLTLLVLKIEDDLWSARKAYIIGALKKLGLNSHK